MAGFSSGWWFLLRPRVTSRSGSYGYIAPSSCWCWFADVLHADVVLAFTMYMAADTLNFVRHPGSRQGVEVTAELSRFLWFSPVWGAFPLEPRGWQPWDIGTRAANSRAPTQGTADRVRSCGPADQLSDQVPPVFFYTDLDGKLSLLRVLRGRGCVLCRRRLHF